MLQYVRQFDSPANVAALSIGFSLVALSFLIGYRFRKPFRIGIPLGIAILIATGVWIWRETPRETDISDDPQYAELFAARLCLAKEAFVTQWRDNRPVAEPAGFGGSTPMSIADYLAHPTDWHRTPAYTKVYGTLWNNYEMPKVLAYAEPGTAVMISQVLEEYRPETRDRVHRVRGIIKGHTVDITLLLDGRDGVVRCSDDRRSTTASNVVLPPTWPAAFQPVKL